MEKVKQMSALVIEHDEDCGLRLKIVLERESYSINEIRTISYSNNMLFVEQKNNEIMGFNLDKVIVYLITNPSKLTKELENVVKNAE